MDGLYGRFTKSFGDYGQTYIDLEHTTVYLVCRDGDFGNPDISFTKLEYLKNAYTNLGLKVEICPGYYPENVILISKGKSI